MLKIIVLRIKNNDELDNDENDLDNSLRAVGMPVRCYNNTIH